MEGTNVGIDRGRCEIITKGPGRKTEQIFSREKIFLLIFGKRSPTLPDSSIFSGFLVVGCVVYFSQETGRIFFLIAYRSDFCVTSKYSLM